MLTLPIKRYWYDMIVSGDKSLEYREPSDYWIKRLRNARFAQHVDFTGRGLKLRIRAGYRKDAPSAIITLWKIDKGRGVTCWGAEPGKEYLRLHINKVEEEVKGEVEV